MYVSYYEQLARLEAERRPFVLATVTDTGGSTPRLAGTQLVVWDGGSCGTIGGGAFEHRVIALAKKLLFDAARRTEHYQVHLVRDLAMCCGGKMSVFLHKVEASPRLTIFGGGHVGAALAPVALAAGFHVTVVDEREEYSAKERFGAGVQVVDAEPTDHLRRQPPASDDYIVVVTHEHAIDEQIIHKLAPIPLRYVGLIGSRGKWGRIRKRLSERGVSDEALDRVRCPVGLDIGAETPAEIAVSIVAELIATRRVPGA